MAKRIAAQMGTQPPRSLIDEVRGLKAEADRLMAIAQAEVNRK